MECPNCHAQIEEGSNFCPQCGYDLRAGKEKYEKKNASGRVEKNRSKLAKPGGGPKEIGHHFRCPPFPFPRLPIKNPSLIRQPRRQSQKEAYREFI
ncbi:MAG: zinc-ribbon domain-containing protein [Aeriscardovia sp.]|nr:zinc-ribbon domain-containing protein [Aeriscardovia sp.]